METRLRQEQKSSKQAKADRIVNSLKMKSSMLSPVPRKVKKKRRSRQTTSNNLTYETENGKKKKVCFVFSRSSGRNVKTYVQKKQENTFLQKRESIDETSQGGYGDLFASVYENLKKTSQSQSGKREKASTDDKSQKNEAQPKQSDGFVSIEYEPLDNYFYLVGADPNEKMALFQNRGIRKKSLVHNFVINPVVLRSLKQDFQLDRLFQ